MKHTLNARRFLCYILVVTFVMIAAVLGAQTNKLTTRVSYNADDATLSSVVTALAKQSGTNIVLATDQEGGTERKERRILLTSKMCRSRQPYLWWPVPAACHIK